MRALQNHPGSHIKPRYLAIAPSKSLCNSLNPPAGPINYSASAAANAKAGRWSWFRAFSPGGTQDFKGNSAYGSPANQAAVGNFNFGASVAAKGWSLSTAMGLAGAGAFLSNVSAQAGYALSQAGYMQGQYGGPSSPNPGAGPQWNMGSGFPGFPSSTGNQGIKKLQMKTKQLSTATSGTPSGVTHEEPMVEVVADLDCVRHCIIPRRVVVAGC